MAVSKTINIWEDSKLVGHVCEMKARAIAERTIGNVFLERGACDINLGEDSGEIEIKAVKAKNDNTGSSIKVSKNESDKINSTDKAKSFIVIFSYISKDTGNQIEATIESIKVVKYCWSKNGVDYYPDFNKDNGNVIDMRNPEWPENTSEKMKEVIKAIYDKMQGLVVTAKVLID